MKTLVITFKTPADGDLVILEYSSVRGGVTSVKHQVSGERTRPVLDDSGFLLRTEPVPAETPRDLASILAKHIAKDWMSEAFEAKVGGAAGEQLIVNCTGLVQDVRFKATVEGSGGTTVDILEL